LNPHEHSTSSRFKEEFSLVRSFGARGYKFSGADGGIKVIKGSIMILKGEQTTNLYKLIGSIIVGDATTAIEKEDTSRLWHMHLEHERTRSSSPTQKECSTRYYILQT